MSAAKMPALIRHANPRRLIGSLAVVLAIAAALPAISSAATRQSGLSYVVGANYPVSPAHSMTVPPPRFHSDGLDALNASKTNATMLALHRRDHPLQYAIYVFDDYEWYVQFSFRGAVVALVLENRQAHVTAVYTGPLALAPYARGNYAPQFGQWFVLVPFSLMFLVPFLDPRRLRRLLHLDGLAILAWLVSYLLFDHAHLVAAVWLAYPPLLYLLGRMLWLGLRGRRGPPARLAPLLSVRTLAVGLGVLVVARIALSFISPLVIDVGYASVIGAHHIIAGQPLYYLDPAHTDTYGPIAYLAYVPFELLFPWHGNWDYLPSAHVASAVFDLVTIAGLVVLGRRMRQGREGLRLGLALGWAWAACPFTLLALMTHTNDGLIAMLSVLSLLSFSSPALRGALLGLGAAAKFAPAALLGVYAGQRDRGLRGAAICVGAFAAVVVVSIGLYLPGGGLSEFYSHTLGYQLGRGDVFSPWALYPSLKAMQIVIEVAVVGVCGLVAFVPRRRRSLIEVCALAAAVTLAVQLPAKHWFYYYIVWFLPFALVAMLGGERPDETDEDVGTTSAAVPIAAPVERELVPTAV